MERAEKIALGSAGVAAVSLVVAALSLLVNFATNRDKVDEWLCGSQLFTLYCAAEAKLDFWSVEGWGSALAGDAVDLWSWGETQASRNAPLTAQAMWPAQGATSDYPLECGQTGHEARIGTDPQAAAGPNLPFGPPDLRPRPPLPSSGSLEPPPPGYDDAVLTRVAYWRLNLAYRESPRTRDLAIREVVRPPVARADENATHSVRTFHVRSGPQFNSCRIMIPIRPGAPGTYRVELYITGDIKATVAGDVKFR